MDYFGYWNFTTMNWAFNGSSIIITYHHRIYYHITSHINEKYHEFHEVENHKMKHLNVENHKMKHFFDHMSNEKSSMSSSSLESYGTKINPLVKAYHNFNINGSAPYENFVEEAVSILMKEENIIDTFI